MRDMTEQHLRRVARALGYKGKELPMTIADVVIHDARPNDFTLLNYAGEKHRDAAIRLRNWTEPREGHHG